MGETVFLPGGRDARGTLDEAAPTDDTGAAAIVNACVVACPPHPRHGGHRGDLRLRAVSDALVERGVDCLRVDYGPWDGGRGEHEGERSGASEGRAGAKRHASREDAINAVAWARARYDRVGLFGYSFGGTVAISAAAHGADVAAVSALAPPARVGAERADRERDETADDSGPKERDIGGIDAVADLDRIPDGVHVQVVYGTRDDVADVGEVVDRARERGDTVVEFAAGHSFIGREATVAAAVASTGCECRRGHRSGGPPRHPR